MIPQQLACPKCGCLLAHFDTDVRRECPNCAHAFTVEAPPVRPSTTPIQDDADTAAAGCAMLIFLFFLSGLVPMNLFESWWLHWAALALLIGIYWYLTRVRRWSQDRAVRARSASLLLLFLAILFGKLLLVLPSPRVYALTAAVETLTLRR